MAKAILVNTTSSPNKVIRKIGYKVRKGDSLARIAKRFQVSVRDLAKWNSLDLKRYLQPGQKLTIHVDVVNT
jgi:membrane-bound lytic murein transglycosylase D